MGYKQWRQSQVDEVKAQIKSELEAIEAESGPDERILHAVRKADENAAKVDSKHQLRAFIYIISALYKHHASPFLEDSHVRKLTKLAEHILGLQRIHPAKSHLSYLWGEMHVVKSLIQRAKGNHLMSAWDLELAHEMTVQKRIITDSAYILGLASRLERLGHIGEAMQYLSQANVAELTPNEKVSFIAKTVRALRMMHRFDEAEAKIEEALADESATELLRVDLEWERTLIAATKSGSVDPILRFLRTIDRFKHANYLVEGWLWTKCHRNPEAGAELPLIKTLKRNPAYKFASIGTLGRLANELSTIYDTEIPFPIRLGTLRELLGDLHQLISIDKEVLFWGAALRFLHASNKTRFSRLCSLQYKDLSKRITEGRSEDVLGVYG